MTTKAHQNDSQATSETAHIVDQSFILLPCLHIFYSQESITCSKEASRLFGNALNECEHGLSVILRV